MLQFMGSQSRTRLSDGTELNYMSHMILSYIFKVFYRYYCYQSASACTQCPVRPNNTKTLESGTEKGLLQGHARRRVAHALNSCTSESFQQSPFLGKVREGCGYLWKLLVRFFVPEVKPWTANQIPINIHQTNGILYSDKKEPGPKAQLSPSEAQVLAKRRQVSAGGSHRARPQDPAQRSLLRQPSTQAPAELQAPQATQMVEIGPARCSPGRWPLPSGHRGWDGQRSGPPCCSPGRRPLPSGHRGWDKQRSTAA